jgi:hypothetical protein
VLDRCYDNGGYQDDLDDEAEPGPLPLQDAAWADALLREGATTPSCCPTTAPPDEEKGVTVPRPVGNGHPAQTLRPSTRARPTKADAEHAVNGYTSIFRRASKPGNSPLRFLCEMLCKAATHPRLRRLLHNDSEPRPFFFCSLFDAVSSCG